MCSSLAVVWCVHDVAVIDAPAALSFSRSAAAVHGAGGRLAPQLRVTSRGGVAGVRMGMINDILARKEVASFKANLPAVLVVQEFQGHRLSNV
jgi:hypothetical protein